VQIEAKMHQYAGLGWDEIARIEGTQEMRGHLDRIADLDRAARRDADEYQQSGGDYWLEMLRSSLRGELPFFVCFFVAEARRHRGNPAALRRAVARWRKLALELCRAEQRLLAGEYGLDPRAYDEMAACVERARGFTLAVLDELLAIWRKYHTISGLRDGDDRQRFEAAFRAWVGDEPTAADISARRRQ
jgi:hypothetical protein